MPKKVTPGEYLLRAITAHGGRYTYDKATLLGATSLARITCPLHGVFVQKLANHLNGAGCPKCAGRGVDWVERFRSVHGDLYDYSQTVFVGYKTPVVIICKDHGPFTQTPDNHYRGRQGCPKCKGLRIRAAKQLPISEFISRATAVHGGRFTYVEKQFSNMLTDNAEIVCREHGSFFQTAVNHLAGKVGCRKCSDKKSSGEDALFSFVNGLVEAKSRDRTLLTGQKELDVYVPSKQLAIEYCGMYWHSLGDKEESAKNKNRHYDKYQECRKLGVRLLTLYEEEWVEHNYAVRRLIRNALGKSRGRLMARKCELREVAAQDARAFYERYHPQGGAGNGEHFALFWNGKMVACMRFTLGANDRGAAAATRTWTLTRYATRITVAGAASKLFKAFLAKHKPEIVKSFSDNRFFDGGMYEKLGFALESENAPDYAVWHRKLGLKPKSHYQRRNIPARLKDVGIEDFFDPDTDSRSEADMTYLMGARRMYDCGKKRWVWTP